MTIEKTVEDGIKTDAVTRSEFKQVTWYITCDECGYVTSPVAFLNNKVKYKANSTDNTSSSR
jgi:hypothetical protein